MSSSVSSSPPAPFTAFVNFPSRFLTQLITRALLTRFPSLVVLSSLPSPPPLPLLQFADYDLLDHELTLHHLSDNRVLSSSYVIRKSLIRKHYLASAVSQYLAKHPTSILSTAAPRTWAIEIRFADELDELRADELWELDQEIEEQEQTGIGLADEERKWYILKPGMADKGQGIRMFCTMEELQEIFEEFEENSDDENEDQDDEVENLESTRVSTQQMRHFVIQEYVPWPLLLDPLPTGTRSFTPHKFHIRAYALSTSSSPLSLFVHPRLLCLFAALPFTSPTSPMSDEQLMAHLTNTCLQAEETKETFVLEVKELLGRRYDAGLDGEGVIGEDDVQSITRGVGDVLAEAWKAAINVGLVHFQPLPNAFELFGCDLLVSHHRSATHKFQVHLLEINACPDVEQTGTRLNGVIEDLIEGVIQRAVLPWVDALGPPGPLQRKGQEIEGTEKESGGLMKVLEIGVRAG